MVDQFGKVMIYVSNPEAVADFWVNKIGFTQVKVDKHEGNVLSVELTPSTTSDAHIVLFDKVVVEKMSPELHLGTPSILFSSYDIAGMRNKLISAGVGVSEISEMGGRKTINFPDIEGNYFAVEEIIRNMPEMVSLS